MDKLIRLDALRNDTFFDDCDIRIKKKLDALRERILPVSTNDTHTNNINENYIVDDFSETTIRRPRRTASRTADLKIKKNLNMPLKLRRPSTDSSHNGTFKFPKTTRTRVLEKPTANASSSAATDKSVDALDEMNLVKKRTKQFEKMSKDQQVALTPNRRNEAAANINECVAVAVTTSSIDNVNNNVVSSATTSVEVNVEECTTTTTTTKRVTRTRTRNAKQVQSTDDSANAATSSTEDVFVKPFKSGRTKIRKELKSVLGGALEDKPEPIRVDREALIQIAKEKELARKAKEKEEEAKKAAEEAAKAAKIEAKKAEEEARRVEEARRQELEKKEKERAREEEKLAKAQEAAAKKKEADKAKKLAMEKKRQEYLLKKEAIKKKHEEINKQRELDAKKREELLQAKKKEADANSKTQHKAADAKENMKPNLITKPPVIKPAHPVVSQLKNATFTSSNYNMTPPRDEREPQKPKTANDYGIDDADTSDSSDDEANPKKIIPDWAKGSALNEQVETQSHMPLDLFHLMMNCNTDPYQTLGYVNKIKRPRTSSAVWHTPINAGH